MADTQEEKMQESIAHVKEQTNDIINSDLVETILKDNKAEFEVNGNRYRVSKPTFHQKLEANKARQKKYIELIKSQDNLFEKELTEIYLTRGIDIADMSKRFDTLEAQKKDISIKLGKAIAENDSQEKLEALKTEIEKILDTQQDIILRKAILLDSAIESQINVFTYTYLSFLVTEKYIKGKDLGEGNKEPDLGWNKAWDSYDTFLNEDEQIVNQVVWYASLIAKNELPIE